MSKQKNQEIEAIENVIYNSLTMSQYHENRCFTLERISERKTKLSLNVTRYGLVPKSAVKKMFEDLNNVFDMNEINVSFQNDKNNTMVFTI